MPLPSSPARPVCFSGALAGREPRDTDTRSLDRGQSPCNDTTHDTGKGTSILKRASLSFLDLLARLAADPELFPEERRRVLAIRRDAASGSTASRTDVLSEFLTLVRGLVARGRWERLEGDLTAGGGGEVLVRDRTDGARFRLHVGPRSARAPGELPVPADPDSAPPPGIARAHLASPGVLVGDDRILGPRDVIARLEAALAAAVPADTARFLAFELGGESATTLPAEGPALHSFPPLGPADLDDLSLRRNRVFRWTHADHGVARLLLGLGDDALGWRGVLVLEAASSPGSGRDRPDGDFGPAEVARATWISSYYGDLLSTVLRLQGLIFYDFLTGVYNRSFYEDQLDRELLLARRRQESMALLLLDIDDFKEFNTRHGYEGGDRVLATVACALKGALRGTDTLARYGGEEFVVILAPPVTAEEAARIAERLLLAVQQEEVRLPDLAGGESAVGVTVSVGGAISPRHGESRADLWTAANLALLTAKRGGKNRVCFAE